MTRKFTTDWLEDFNKLLLARSTPTYPPYNIVSNGPGDNTIHMAVAGFSKDQIKIAVLKDELTISARSDIDEQEDYIYRGLAKRPFDHTFRLAPDAKVQKVTLKDGMLSIRVTRKVEEPTEVIIPIDGEPQFIQD